MDMLGGAFGLELPHFDNFPYAEGPCCAYVNSGRSALECLLCSMPRPARVWVPRFTCDTVLQPLVRMGLPILRYELTEDWLPELPECTHAEDLLLLTNYFGLTGEAVTRAAAAHPGPCIVDATTALFAPPGELPTFYSLRKFAGVPDGGVACAPFALTLPEHTDSSSSRALALLQRVELGARGSLPAFEQIEAELGTVPSMRMSLLTRTLMAAIDWKRVAEIRLANYAELHRQLGAINRWNLPKEAPTAPFCYPLMSGIPGLRDDLIEAGLALPIFWPEVIRDTPAYSRANTCARSLLPLPIDQRYTPEQIMERWSPLCPKAEH